MSRLLPLPLPPSIANDPARKDVYEWIRRVNDILRLLSAGTIPGAIALDDLSASAPITYNSATGAFTFAYGNGLTVTAGQLVAALNATNLKIAAGQINTVQDLATTSSPSFVTVTGTTSVVGGTGGNDTTGSETGLRQNGTARTWQDINFEAINLRPGVTPPTWAVIGPSGNVYGWHFAGTGVIVDELFGGGEILHDYAEGTDIRLHLHWEPTTADAGNVKFLVDYVWTNVNGVTGAPTTVSAVQAAAGVAWTHQLLSVATITGTGMEIGSHFNFRVYRDPADVADTYAHDVWFKAIGIHFEQDTLGSRSVADKT